MSEPLRPWQDLLNLQTFTQDELDRMTVEEQRKILEERYSAYLGSDLGPSIVQVMRHRDDIGQTTQSGDVSSFTRDGLKLMVTMIGSTGEGVASADLHGIPIIRDSDTEKLFIPGKWLEDPFRKLDEEADRYKPEEPVREQREVRQRFAREILEPQPPPTGLVSRGAEISQG